MTSSGERNVLVECHLTELRQLIRLHKYLHEELRGKVYFDDENVFTHEKNAVHHNINTLHYGNVHAAIHSHPGWPILFCSVLDESTEGEAAINIDMKNWELSKDPHEWTLRDELIMFNYNWRLLNFFDTVCKFIGESHRHYNACKAWKQKVYQLDLKLVERFREFS